MSVSRFLLSFKKYNIIQKITRFQGVILEKWYQLSKKRSVQFSYHIIFLVPTLVKHGVVIFSNFYENLVHVYTSMFASSYSHPTVFVYIRPSPNAYYMRIFYNFCRIALQFN